MVPSFSKDEPTPTICCELETQAITASSTELIPSVAMKESIRTLTMSRPLASPTSAPASRVRTIAGTSPTPLSTSNQATKIAPKPSSAPIARSKAPAESAITSPIARIAVTAWLSKSDFQVFHCRNVSGTQIEKTMNMTAKM